MQQLSGSLPEPEIVAIYPGIAVCCGTWVNLPPIPIPTPSILDDCELLGFVGGERRWRSKDGKRLYTWDALHGEVEVFNRRGRHLGAIDPRTGIGLKPAVPGRRIDV
jgi:hypothetical protein